MCVGRLVPAKDKAGESNTADESPPTLRRRALATCWAFFVSGVMHELFIVYWKRRVSGYWLAFFMLQGPLVIGDSVARRWLRVRGWTVPRPVATVLTLGLLLAMGDALFFPDIVRMGIAQNVIDNIDGSIPVAVKTGVAAVLAGLRPFS
jgi:hypothetical protein